MSFFICISTLELHMAFDSTMGIGNVESVFSAKMTDLMNNEKNTTV